VGEGAITVGNRELRAMELADGGSEAYRIDGQHLDPFDSERDCATCRHRVGPPEVTGRITADILDAATRRSSGVGTPIGRVHLKFDDGTQGNSIAGRKRRSSHSRGRAG